MPIAISPLIPKFGEVDLTPGFSVRSLAESAGETLGKGIERITDFHHTARKEGKEFDEKAMGWAITGLGVAGFVGGVVAGVVNPGGRTVDAFSAGFKDLGRIPGVLRDSPMGKKVVGFFQSAGNAVYQSRFAVPRAGDPGTKGTLYKARVVAGEVPAGPTEEGVTQVFADTGVSRALVAGGGGLMSECNCNNPLTLRCREMCKNR